MAALTLVSRIVGGLLLLYGAGLIIAGVKYPLLPVKWRRRRNTLIRWHGLLWLIPAGYGLAGPPAAFQLYHQPTPVAMLAGTVVILGWAVWAGLMAFSIVLLSRPHQSNREST